MSGAHGATTEAKIRALIEDWSNALRVKDADRVVSHYAGDIVQFSLAPPLISTAADARGLGAWFSTWQGPIGYEIRGLSITAGDTVAYCHSVNRLSGTRTDGEKADVWFRHTLCLRKTGDRWQIAHEHESVPFYMDGSYRAAVDLAPEPSPGRSVHVED
jgi:PhnB protein